MYYHIAWFSWSAKISCNATFSLKFILSSLARNDQRAIFNIRQLFFSLDLRSQKLVYLQQLHLLMLLAYRCRYPYAFYSHQILLHLFLPELSLHAAIIIHNRRLGWQMVHQNTFSDHDGVNSRYISFHSKLLFPSCHQKDLLA